MLSQTAADKRFIREHDLVEVIGRTEVELVPLAPNVLFFEHRTVYVLSDDEAIAARYLCDDHVRMASERYMSILLAAQTSGWRQHAPYPICPMLKWLQNGSPNYLWLYQHLLAVHVEYKYRFNALPFVVPSTLSEPRTSSGDSTVASPPPQCIPEEYRVRYTRDSPNRWQNCTQAFMRYYIEEHRDATWTKRMTPVWFSNGVSRRNAELTAQFWAMQQP